MSVPQIYPGTSMNIPIVITKVSDGSAVDPSSTLNVAIEYSDETTVTYSISDLTHDSTGNYSKVHLFPLTAPAGRATITVTADGAVTLTAITNVAQVDILELP